MNSFVYFILDMDKVGFLVLLWMLINVSFAVFILYKIVSNNTKHEKMGEKFFVCALLSFMFCSFISLLFPPSKYMSDIIKQNFTQEEQDFAFYQYGEFKNIGTAICYFSDYGGDTCQAYLKEKIKRVKQEYTDRIKKKQEESAKLERINNNIKKLGGE